MAEHELLKIEGELIDERVEFSAMQLCRTCATEHEFLERLVAEGVLEPVRREGSKLYFPASCLKRTRVVVRLRKDLGVNLAGAALAVELLERIEALEARLRRERSSLP